MSIGKAIIARAQPYILVAKAKTVIDLEAIKGCSPEIYSSPVSLEPPYSPILTNMQIPDDFESIMPGSFLDHQCDQFERLQILVPPDHPLDWLRAELFLKSLRSSNREMGFEIIGNEHYIEFCFLIHREDMPLLQTAFKSQHRDCELASNIIDINESTLVENGYSAEFYDYYPDPPYSHLFTQPAELKLSPFEIILESLAKIPSPSLGIYQLLFKGADPGHDWHRNINILNDFEYAMKLMSGIPMAARVPFQPPSGDLRGMAIDDQTKAHNDKPIFAAAMKIGVLGLSDDSSPIQGLSSFVNLFQHGGRPLRHLNRKEYLKILTSDQIRGMFFTGQVYRHGFLLNSSELAGMVHIPPGEALKRRKIQIEVLKIPPLESDELLDGTPIGTANYAGSKITVCIPAKVRFRSTHLIARQGMGKSTVMEHMALHDISTGAGIAVLDPHGDLVFRMLHMIPAEYIDKVIYLCWSDPEWVPLWNPLQTLRNQDLSRTTDEIVSAIKSIVQGWGDRLENLLRHAIYGLLHIEGSTLQDVSNLLRKKSKESDCLIEKILGIVESEASRQFWKYDFNKYNNQDLAPPQHKLSKLLLSGNVSLMLSQPENKIGLRDIMDTGKILLVDLSGIGAETGSLLGSLILSLFRVAAVGRSDTPYDQRKDFHIFCDEAHKFLTTSLEDIIPEARKFKVSLTLAHQYLRQFGLEKRDSILTTGSTLIFNVDLNDAGYLTKDLQGKVKPEDLASFDVGDAIARIGTNIVRIKTREPLRFLEPHSMQRIIDESHRRYYRSAADVKNVISGRQPQERPSHYYVRNEKSSGNDTEEIKYDEFN